MMSRTPRPDDASPAQVRHLLSGVCVHHLAEVERDLVQMDALLNEAIKKLCGSFMAIHRAIDQQHELLCDTAAEEPARAERVDALREEIGRHVGAAVTGLQFQDMTSQLIGRMVQHLAGLRDVFGTLGADGASGAPEPAGDATGIRRAESGTTVRSAVNQRHMESGDIELF